MDAFCSDKQDLSQDSDPSPNLFPAPKDGSTPFSSGNHITLSSVIVKLCSTVVYGSVCIQSLKVTQRSGIQDQIHPRRFKEKNGREDANQGESKECHSSYTPLPKAGLQSIESAFTLRSPAPALPGVRDEAARLQTEQRRESYTKRPLADSQVLESIFMSRQRGIHRLVTSQPDNALKNLPRPDGIGFRVQQSENV